MHSLKLRAVTLVVFHTRIILLNSHCSYKLFKCWRENGYYKKIGETTAVDKLYSWHISIHHSCRMQQTSAVHSQLLIYFFKIYNCSTQVRFLSFGWKKRQKEERKDRDRWGEHGRKDLSLYKDIRSKSLCKDFFSPVVVYLRNMGWVWGGGEYLLLCHEKLQHLAQRYF